MYNRRELKVESTAKKLPTPKDVIVDPMGQWKYPGEITKIPSNQITMEGVPYPVLGVDNLGNEQMMYPGLDYTFPGQSVTEYPQLDEARYGGLKRSKRKTNNPAVGINDLMLRNPQYHTRKRSRFVPFKEEGGSTGGWLDKYQEGGPSMYLPIQTYNPSETVNQSKIENPYKKAAIQKAADEKERLAYLEQEKQKKANEDKVRERIRAQQALDLKNKVPGYELYDEDYEVQNHIKQAEYKKKIEERTNEMMGNLALGLLPIGELAQGAKWLGNAATKEASFLANRWGNMAGDAVNASKESGVLSNAYKLNPWAVKKLPGSPNAPKGNMYGENQVLTQQSRLLDPEIKAKFFEHQASHVEPDFSKKGLFQSKFVKIPRDYGNRITPENYDEFVKNIHGSTEYGIAAPTGFRPGNLGVGNYGKPGTVFSDAPLNNLGKDIINAHEKNHGMFAGTLSKEMSKDLLKPFGTNKPIPFYGAKAQPDEVLARMAQFKNAVGIGDNQSFTLGHLNLIRKNYANSFLDNGITEMLNKIKPGSSGEKEFLKNMNKYAFGIGTPVVIGAAAFEKKLGGQNGWLDKYK
jgi:hypothetical protein